MSHVASDEHLLSYVLAVPFVLICSTVRSLGKYVLEIRLQEPLVSEICQLGVGVVCNLRVDVEIVFTIFVE